MIDIFGACEKRKITLAYEYDAAENGKPKPPEVSDDQIRFNGLKDEGHETFTFHKKMPKPQPWIETKECFNFCKTAGKPYDLAVGLSLLAAHKHAPNTIKISSDGDWDGDWAEIRKAYKEIFGKEAVCPFKVGEPA